MRLIMFWRIVGKYGLNFSHIIPTFNDPGEEDLKILWEKEKMLFTIIFSFSHSTRIFIL